MRDVYQEVFARVFLANLVRERMRMDLTQDRMSELLCMSLRSYSYLESGETSCGTLTLVLFLLYCCEDQARFLREVKAAFADAYAAL